MEKNLIEQLLSRPEMDKAEKIPYSIGDNFVAVLAKTTGFDTKAMVKELTDNAIEADAKTVNLNLVNLPDEHVLFSIKDDGLGMSMDDIRTKYFRFAEATNKKKGVHASMGTSSIWPSLAKGGMFRMTTHKLGYPSVFIEWDGETLPKAIYLDEDAPIGTNITLTSVRSTQTLEDELRGELSIRYFKTRGVNIFLNDKEIQLGKYADPLYWWYKDEKSSGWKYEKTDNHPTGDDSVWEDYRYERDYPIVGKNGKTYNVHFRIRDVGQISDNIQNPIYRDDAPGENGKPNKLTSAEYAGVYLSIDGCCITLGDGKIKPYIDRGWHQICSKIRVMIDIPKELAQNLNYSLNKSKGITGLNTDPAFKDAMSEWKRVYEIFVRRNINKQEEKSTQKAASYRREINTGTSQLVFGTTSDKRLSTNTFAVRNYENNGFEYNLNSNIAKKFINRDGSIGKFDVAVDVSSFIYAAFSKALSEARKTQPMINVELSPAQQAKETRDYTLSVVKEVFDNLFMNITTDN